ncbi:DUF1090 domain-containing protein [Variovorax sp. GB1P17]|uniref:DUF1090 domain-containing protein n=1 Tax=Variovorax sp. GB1P17 TaxID=3443740 RepID=UPI003F44C541
MKTAYLSLIFVMATASASAFAQPAAGTCEAKRQEISNDIAAAREKGLTEKVRGLERALAQNQHHCSDAKLSAAHAKKVRAEEQKVAQRQRDLDTAQHDGNAKKIARRQAKLDEAKAELERVKAQPPGATVK